MKLLLISAAVAVLVFTGCTTRSKVRATEQAAFRAGQQAERARQNGVSFIGPVLNTVVPWTEKLTLAQAIVAAQWVGKSDPRHIIITHGEERMEMSPEEAVAGGGDFPLQPGDTVELVP